MFSLLTQVDRWKVLVLVALCVSLLMLKISLTGWTILRVFNQTDSIESKLENNATVLSDQFSFPDINETDIILRNLTIYPRMIHYNGSLKDKQNETENIVKSLFQPGLSQEERQVLLMLFQTFIRACNTFNIPFFLYGGTLLGAMRHHDMIPWDDDIDVIVNTTSKSSLREALSSTGKQFGMHTPKDRWWKFYWVNTNTLPDKLYRWPYIDIFFFTENETHVFDESSDYKHSYSFPKKHVFPLKLHPFAGAMLPVPCKLEDVVTHNYSPQLCVSSRYAHKLEQFISNTSQKTISCKNLELLYPFVHRRVIGDSVYEDLMKGSTLISTYLVPKD